METENAASEERLEQIDAREAGWDRELPDRLSYAELRSFSEQFREQEARNYMPDDAICRIFEHDLTQYSVISFDIFDTLLVRRIDHPINVFYYLQFEQAFQALKFKTPLPLLRKAAEDLSRQLLYKSIGSIEVNLSEIYAVFCKQNGLSLEIVASLVEAEENVERKLCIPSPFIAGLYDMALQAGKRVVVASDMYLRKPFLRALLHEKGIEVSAENLYVSSDLRVSKQSLDLYRKMIRDLHVAPASILHVGDHPISDYERPRQLGVRAILHTHKASSESIALCESDETLAVQSWMRGMIRVKRSCSELSFDFWEWLGYRVIGPFVTGFCCWLEARFKADSIERAWFLTRDGELPERVYKALFSETEGTPVSTLLSSRRAFVLPTLDIAPQIALPKLCVCLNRLPVREYLERLNVHAEKFELEFRASGFKSLDERIDGRIDYQKLQALFHQPRVLEALTQRCRYERALLEKYLEQEGLCSGKRIAVVDLGWNGSIQKAAHHLLARKVPSLDLTGYYIGTSATFSNNEPPGMKHHSFLMQRGGPAHVAQGLYKQGGVVLLEIIFSSVERGLVRFEKKGGKIEGVFQAQDKTEEQCSILQRIHDGALTFAREFKEARKLFPLGEIPPQVAAENLLRLFAHPTPEEAEKIGGLEFIDNYGNTSRQYVAKFKQPFSPSSLLNDCRLSCWSTGLVAQDNEQAMALRSLLWMLDAKTE